MKKIYLLALCLGVFSLSSYAQIEQSDDFESYTPGLISPQDPQWRTWSGDNTTTENGIVTLEQSNSPTQSMKIGPGVAGGGPQDQLFLIASQPFFGTYQSQWMMYVPSGNEGYFNVQGTINTPQTGSFISSDIYFNQNNGSPGVGSTPGFTWAFPHDAWFPVFMEFDIDAKTWQMDVNGVNAIPAGTPWNDATAPYLGGFDFFSTSAFTLYYIDDLLVGPGILGTNDFSAEVFSVYPNPVKDVLNITSRAIVDNVTVYDMLGKVVLQDNPSTISPTINMSGLSNGAYMVKVTIGDTSKTLKVIK